MDVSKFLSVDKRGLIPMTSPAAEKMTCPKCGFEMNHHGDKLVYGPDSQTPRIDEHLGLFLEEFHACPNCGAVASRPAGTTS